MLLSLFFRHDLTEGECFENLGVVVVNTHTGAKSKTVLRLPFIRHLPATSAPATGLERLEPILHAHSAALDATTLNPDVEELDRTYAPLR